MKMAFQRIGCDEERNLHTQLQSTKSHYIQIKMELIYFSRLFSLVATVLPLDNLTFFFSFIPSPSFSLFRRWQNENEELTKMGSKLKKWVCWENDEVEKDEEK